MKDDDLIQRPSLHDELATRLRRMIVEDELKPGVRISEADLCTRFGVSRTPVREAIKVLAREGYICLTPNRGSSVAVLSDDDMREAFLCMGALEGLAGELAARNATDAQIAELVDLNAQMKTAYAEGRRSDYFKLNEAIHTGMAEAAGNATLIRLQRSLDGRLRRARYRANLSDTRWTEAVAEHDEIASALAERDGARLSELLKRHLANKLTALGATGRGDGAPSEE